MIALDKTYAVIVAIESYARMGDTWKLPGVTTEAVAFTKWLIQTRGLPPENIQVFGTEDYVQPFADLGIDTTQCDYAHAEAIKDFFTYIGKHWPDGELLFIYWSGHGVVSNRGDRRLFFGDTGELDNKNLDFNELQQLLQSDMAGTFYHQIAFIDACAKFFEELQSTETLPAGGLNKGAPLRGVNQSFYFSASNGEYAENGFFGSQVLKLLNKFTSWPLDTRSLRDEIDHAFDQFNEKRSSNQHPVWLEYRTSSGEGFTHGILPTFDDIHKICVSAKFPVLQLRTLTGLAAECGGLTKRSNRDLLAAAIEANSSLNIYRPAESRDDPRLDLMWLIAGAIQQGKIHIITSKIIEIECTSPEAVFFKTAANTVVLLQSLWALIIKIKLPFARYLALYKRSHLLPDKDGEPGSIEEILKILLDLTEPVTLVEFLIRVVREHPGNLHHRQLQQWLENKPEWAQELEKVKEYLETEDTARRYLQVEIQKSGEGYRVIDYWFWQGSKHDSVLKNQAKEKINLQNDLGQNINNLVEIIRKDIVNPEGIEIYIEILVPADLLHFPRNMLAWKSYKIIQYPERRYPVVLRWSERMRFTRSTGDYQAGLWTKNSALIRQQLANMRRGVYWFDPNTEDIDEFFRKFEANHCGEIIGIPIISGGDSHDDLIGIICLGGIPYACWPRCSTVNLEVAKNTIQTLIDQNQFDDIPSALPQYRNNANNSLSDVIFLWDDPKRNPYCY
jgi:hypothetical protein